jgi:prepilin signal peptidase PulO-like enzyme (type II secretory pathway)
MLVLFVLYRGRLGMGNVKAAIMVGAFSGFPRVLWALGISILIGALVALAFLLLRLAGRHTRIPYAQFIMLGGLIAMLWPMG